MSDTELSPEEELLKKHRKERKDLQAKIQSLKKTTSKGDKKKKKEVTEEIAKMEKELDDRHEEELKQLREQELSDKVADVVKVTEEQEQPTGRESEQKSRISKAQKRRDKKATKEKERLAEIEKQEELNLTGSRQIEMDKVKAILSKRGLSMFDIPSDGDCMYAGLSHQLQEVRAQTLSVHDLRKLAANTIEQHSDDFIPFLCDPTTGDLMSPDSFKNYVNRVANSKDWGGQVELRALSQSLKVPIEVIQAEGIPTIIGDEYGGDRLILTFHRHMYGLGEHYNSTVKPRG